jgi:hypothetical protein
MKVSSSGYFVHDATQQLFVNSRDGTVLANIVELVFY